MPSQGYWPYGFVSGAALWDWDLSSNNSALATVVSYAGKPTKCGALPADLQMVCGVPLQYYAPAGTTPQAIPPEVMIDWIRQSEDWVEQETGLLLTPTWIASPPELVPFSAQVTGVPDFNGNGQILGVDYDLADAGYDFYFEKFVDDGWGCQPLRYRPIRNVTQTATDFTAVKNISAVYPLLNQFFKVPPTWYVEDQDFGLIRLVPSANVQMLPLFAMEIAIMGFSQTVPGAWHFQYTAGLTPTDYNTRFRFIKRLVLVDAAIRALASVQGTINMGMMRVETLVDGLQTKLQYSEAGPFGSLIKQFTAERDTLLNTALTKVMGPMIVTM